MATTADERHQSSEQSSAPNNAPALRTLSRSALYTPLSSYSTPLGGGTERTRNRNLEKKLREQNLFSFLHDISARYHDPTAGSALGSVGYDGGNHGSRAKNVVHFQRSLEQRALTLIGGGVGNLLAPSTDSLVRSDCGRAPATRSTVVGGGRRVRRKGGVNRVHGAISNRERKRRCRSFGGNHGKEGVCSVESIGQSREEDRQDILGRVSSQKGNGIASGGNRATTNTLFGLNQLWNNYIQILLRDRTPLDSEVFRPNEIASLLSSAEFVGAFVNIVRCVSHLSHRGMSGFVVDITANTWRVAVVPKGVTWDIEKEGMEDLKSRCGNKGWKVVTVPKRNSTLAMWIACRSTNEQASKDAKYFCVEISGNE